MKREISEVIIGWMFIFQLEGIAKSIGFVFPEERERGPGKSSFWCGCYFRWIVPRYECKGCI